MNKRVLVGAVKYGLGIGLMAWMVWRYWEPPADGSAPGLGEILQRPIQFLPLTAAAVICLASVLLTFVRWYVLVRAQDMPFALRDAIRLGFVGYFLSTFLPGSVGGDIIKAAALARQQSRRTVAVATVMIDRGVGLWGLFWLVAIMGSVFWLAGDPTIHDDPRLQKVLVTSLALVGVTSALWLVLVLLPTRRAQNFAGTLEKIPKVGHSAAEFWRAVYMYSDKPRSMGLAMLLAVIGHCGFVITYYLASQTFMPLSQLPSLKQSFLIVPIGMTFAALFPAPGGLGGAEAAFGYLYQLLSKPFENGVVGSISYRLISWSIGLIGYIVYLRMPSSVYASEEEAEKEIEPISETAIMVAE